MKNIDLMKRLPVGNIPTENVDSIVGSMNTLLATEYALFTKTLNFHWNVTGPRFHSLHTFLEGQYNALLPIMDSIAERIRFFGEVPHSTVAKMASSMEISEVNGANLSSNDMLLELFKGHQIIHDQIGKILHNEEMIKNLSSTEDFLIGIQQKHEEMSWMLKSHLEQ